MPVNEKAQSIEHFETIFNALLVHSQQPGMGAYNKELGLKVFALIQEAEGTTPLSSLEARYVGEAKLKLEDEDIPGSLNALAKLIAIRKPSMVR